MARSAVKRQVLLCGYYGEHNIGDDALLKVLLAQLPDGWRPVVTAHDQEQIRAMFGVTTTERRSLGGVLRALAGCDALVLGGGSLLQDSTSFKSLLYYAALILLARLRGEVVLLWGQGLGPLRRRRSRALTRWLLSLVTAMSWRDPGSSCLATTWGTASFLGSDPVWSLATLVWQGKGGPIVLCWRPVPQLNQAGWGALLQALDQLAVAADRQVLWLPMHRDQDSGLLDDLAHQGLIATGLRQRSRVVAVARPEQAMAVLQGAGLVLAMRLHGLILAALSGSPCAALSYDPKVTAAATALGCPCQDLMDEPDPAQLLSAWQATLDVPPDPERIAAQRDDALVHQNLFQFLES